MTPEGNSSKILVSSLFLIGFEILYCFFFFDKKQNQTNHTQKTEVTSKNSVFQFFDPRNCVFWESIQNMKMKEIISCVLDNNLSQRLLLSCWFSIIFR